MNDHEQSREQFLPETVDEQVDELIRLHCQQKTSMAPNEQFVHDLHTLYTTNTGVRERVWERLVERIASNDATTASLRAEREQAAQEQGRSFERYYTMKQEILTPRRTHIQRLSLVASVVFTALIVGSMAWIFTLVRYQDSGSEGGSAGVTKQSQTFSQQKQPSYAGVYVNSGKSLLRVDLQTGKVIWRYELPSIATSYDKNTNAVTVARFVPVGDTVYALITSSSNRYKTSVIALKAENGKERWSQPLTGKDFTSIDMIVADNVIYVSATASQSSDRNNVVYSFAARDGKHETTYSVPAYIYYITAVKGTLYVATDDGLYAFDLASHQQRWHTILKAATAHQSLIVTRPYIVNGVLYAAVVSDNEAGPTESRVAAFRADSGKQLWQSGPMQGQVFDLTVSNGVIYSGSIITNVQAFEGKLYAYDALKGKQLWSQPTSGGVQWAPSVSNGVVYVSAYVGIKQSENVLAVDAGDGKQLWQHQVIAGLMTTPYEQNGIVYVADGFNNGKLYALKARSGAQVWALDLGGEPQALAVVS